jgi:hypothetical protein
MKQDVVVWTGLIRLRLETMAMNLRFPQKVGSERDYYLLKTP